MRQSASPEFASLSLSTMWMQHRYSRVADFAAAARDLGFGGIEISHIVTPAMLDGDDPAGWGVTAVHYPAPLLPSPYGAPADALLSSAGEDQRRWAVAQGYATLDFAARAGARAVCLHLGTTALAAHWEWALGQRYLAGQARAGSAFYEATRRALVRERAAVAEIALQAAQRSLAELADYARLLGIRLGIESRAHYREIPCFEELGRLLADSDPQVVGFWYDCGHVQLLENLGFHRHRDWLAAYGPRIVGVHFHDVAGLRDHLIPGQGELDFSEIAVHLPGDAARTCEFDWYFEAEEVRSGASHLLASGCHGK